MILLFHKYDGNKGGTMKRVVLMLVGLGAFIGARVVNAQWHEVPFTVPVGGPQGVTFCDANNGIAVGTARLVLWTSDRGQNWDVTYPPIPAGAVNFTSAVLYDSVTAIVVSSSQGGPIIRTTDRGQFWYHVNVPVNNCAWIKAARMGSITVVVGITSTGKGVILRSTNSGQSFTATVFEDYAGFLGISVVDSMNAWICGAQGGIFQTLDAGQSILDKRFQGEPVSATAMLGDVYDISFADTNTGYFPVYGGDTTRIYATHNAGARWKIVYERARGNPGSVVQYLLAIDSAEAYASLTGSGAPIIIRTLDGGETWDTVFVSHVAGGLNAFYKWDSNNFCAIASRAFYYYTRPPLPSAAALLAPANGATNVVTNNLALTCQNQPGVVRYEFSLASDSLFSNPTVVTSTAPSASFSRLENNAKHWWKVRYWNESGWGPFSPVWSFTTSLTGVMPVPGLPETFVLAQNYPNPFNPVTWINFSVPTRTHVTLKVYDYLGQEVATLVSEELQPGNYQADFSPTTSASGVYLYRLQAAGFSQTRKLLFLK